MIVGPKRRDVLALLGASLVNACMSSPDAVTAENAPHDLAHSGKAYVVFDIHERVNDIFGDRRSGGGQFINAAATPNLLYARTPASMKLNLGSLPNPQEGINAIDPGTYFLESIGLGGNPCLFGPGDSPVTFSVAAGEVVYLGSLQYESFRAHNPNPLANPRYHVTFQVNDELDIHRAGITKNLALLPGNPAIQTRLMTIRRQQMMVGSTKANWLDTPPPPEDNTPPESPPPPPPTADPSAPWHESPSQ